MVFEDEVIDHAKKSIQKAVETINSTVKVAAESVEQKEASTHREIDAATKLAQKKFEEMKGKDEMLAWARSQVILSKWSDAADAFREICRLHPEDLAARIEYSRVLLQAGDITGAKAVADTIRNSPTADSTVTTELKLDEMMALLYQPDQHAKVVQIGEELKNRPEVTSQARYWLYIASAHGQEYKHKLSAGETPDQLAAVRAKALAAVKKVKSLDRDHVWERFLRGLLDPARVDGHPSDDDDLTAFKDDIEFKNAIE